MKLLGFKYLICNSGEVKGRNGVAVLSKIKPLKAEYNFGSEHDKNGRFVMLEFENFFLINLYVQCSGEGLKFMQQRMTMDRDLCFFLKELQKRKPSILIGDMNVVHHNVDMYNTLSNKESTPSCTPQEKENFSEMLAAFDLVDSWRA